MTILLLRERGGSLRAGLVGKPFPDFSSGAEGISLREEIFVTPCPLHKRSLIDILARGPPNFCSRVVRENYSRSFARRTVTRIRPPRNIFNLIVLYPVATIRTDDVKSVLTSLLKKEKRQRERKRKSIKSSCRHHFVAFFKLFVWAEPLTATAENFSSVEWAVLHEGETLFRVRPRSRARSRRFPCPSGSSDPLSISHSPIVRIMQHGCSLQPLPSRRTDETYPEPVERTLSLREFFIEVPREAEPPLVGTRRRIFPTRFYSPAPSPSVSFPNGGAMHRDARLPRGATGFSINQKITGDQLDARAVVAAREFFNSSRDTSVKRSGPA